MEWRGGSGSTQLFSVAARRRGVEYGEGEDEVKDVESIESEYGESTDPWEPDPPRRQLQPSAAQQRNVAHHISIIISIGS